MLSKIIILLSYLGMNDLSVYTEGDDVKPNNPFAERRKKQHTLLEIALEVLQTITCRKGPSKFVKRGKCRRSKMRHN